MKSTMRATILLMFFGVMGLAHGCLQCPKPSDQIGICVELCTAGDPGSCEDGQVCCSNGCGHACYQTCGANAPCPDNQICCPESCDGQSVCRDPLPCTNKCEFGYTKDHTCQCCESWCDPQCYPCQPGQVCRPDVIICVTQPCPQRQCIDLPHPGKVECPLIKCAENCPFGYVMDADGCRTCECCNGPCDPRNGCFPCKRRETCTPDIKQCLLPPCPQYICNRPKPDKP